MTCSLASGHDKKLVRNDTSSVQVYLRWDKADKNSYYSYTGQYLQSTLLKLDNAIKSHDTVSSDTVDNLYEEIISTLISGARLFVPTRQKQFYEFWWNEEFDMLKEAAVQSHNLWKSAGKPRQGPIFNKRQLCRAQYRKGIRDGQKLHTMSYTNDLMRHF